MQITIQVLEFNPYFRAAVLQFSKTKQLDCLLDMLLDLLKVELQYSTWKLPIQKIISPLSVIVRRN